MHVPFSNRGTQKLSGDPAVHLSGGGNQGVTANSAIIRGTQWLWEAWHLSLGAALQQLGPQGRPGGHVGSLRC